jgi:hypothetical protein
MLRMLPLKGTRRKGSQSNLPGSVLVEIIVLTEVVVIIAVITAVSVGPGMVSRDVNTLVGPGVSII